MKNKIKKSTSYSKVVQKAQKLVEKTEKDATSKARFQKKGKTKVVLDFNEDAFDEDLEEQAKVQDAQDSLLHAHTLVHASTKLKRKTRVGNI